MVGLLEEGEVLEQLVVQGSGVNVGGETEEVLPGELAAGEQEFSGDVCAAHCAHQKHQVHQVPEMSSLQWSVPHR